ncbi:MAG: phage integrase family protein [Edaphobacter sp.]|nr:phage integrase family protein [Edaphobacter sp.]
MKPLVCGLMTCSNAKNTGRLSIYWARQDTSERFRIPDWVKGQLDEWLRAAGIARGRIFRRVTRMGRTWGDCTTEKSIWHIVKDCAKGIGMPKLAPHDLRRTCARLCHAAGGELEQIHFLLGHVSVQTTERYLGCKQRIRSAVNDRIGIEPNP